MFTDLPKRHADVLIEYFDLSIVIKCSEFTYSNSSCFRCVGVMFDPVLVIIIIIISNVKFHKFY